MTHHVNHPRQYELSIIDASESTCEVVTLYMNNGLYGVHTWPKNTCIIEKKNTAFYKLCLNNLCSCIDEEM